MDKAELAAMKKQPEESSKLMNQAEMWYEKADIDNIMFYYAKKASILRGSGHLAEAEDVLKRFRSSVKSFKGAPFYQFYYYYELALVSFLKKDVNSFEKTFKKVKELLKYSDMSDQYTSLLRPLEIVLKNKNKDQSSYQSELSQAVENMNSSFKASLRSREIDKIIKSVHM